MNSCQGSNGEEKRDANFDSKMVKKKRDANFNSKICAEMQKY